MTLFFYVLKDFFKYVLSSMFLCTFLFILFDFIHKTTRYLDRYNPQSQDLILYYIYQTPNLLLQALPIAALLSSVICMVLLSRTNEITAMRAAGMSPLRVGAPVAVGGAILVVISMLLGEVILPVSARKMHYIQKVKMEKHSELQIAEGARWIRDGSALYNFKDYDPLTRTMIGVRVIYTGNGFRPKRTLEAQQAVYKPQSDDWQLYNVKMVYFWPNGTVSYTEQRKTLSIPIPVEPQKLKKERRLSSELSLGELSEIISQGKVSGLDVLSLEVDMHVKFAFYFAAFVVCLIGLKFGYKSERTMETARGILLAIAIGVSYWFILNAGRALGKRGTLPPLMSAWLANVVVFAAAMVSIYRTRKN